MKQFILFSAFVASLIAAVSCSVRDIDSPESEYHEGQEMVFTARFGNYETKSALQSNETSIWWSKDDAVKIFYGASAGSCFTATNEDDEFPIAHFQGELTGFTGQTEPGVPNYFWAVYPYEAAGSSDGHSVGVTLPAVQTAKAGSFDNNTNIALAKSPGLDLFFYNVCAWFRFSVTKEGVKSVVFRGNNDENVAGSFTVSMGEDGTPTQPEPVLGEKEIILNAPEGESLEVGQMYYITLIPGVFQNGFTVTFHTDTEVGTRNYTKSSTFTKSKYNTGNNFDSNVQYQIEKTVLYYTSMDGEVNPGEESGFDAPIISYEFDYNTGEGSIIFDGELTTISERAFFGCDNLTSVIIPNTVSTIEGWAFARCRNLESVTIPESVESIGERAFFNTGLTSLNIPLSVTSIDVAAFSYCSNLSLIKVDPENEIYDSPDGCNAIIEKKTKTVIAGCKNTVLPSRDITGISEYAFMGLTGLKSFTIPVTVQNIGDNAFFDCTGMTEITFLPDLPPSGGLSVFGQCTALKKIYVPKGKVPTYQNTAPWSDYAKIIDTR